MVLRFALQGPGRHAPRQRDLRRAAVHGRVIIARRIVGQADLAEVAKVGLTLDHKLGGEFVGGASDEIPGHESDSGYGHPDRRREDLLRP
jgi:hypothetical protein